MAEMLGLKMNGPFGIAATIGMIIALGYDAVIDEEAIAWIVGTGSSPAVLLKEWASLLQRGRLRAARDRAPASPRCAHRAHPCRIIFIGGVITPAGGGYLVLLII